MIDLWVEGYSISGNKAQAKKLGDFNCETLKCAVKAFRESLDSDISRGLVNVDNMTYWGCRFFDNEVAARKHFG